MEAGSVEATAQVPMMSASPMMSAMPAATVVAEAPPTTTTAPPTTAAATTVAPTTAAATTAAATTVAKTTEEEQETTEESDEEKVAVGAGSEDEGEEESEEKDEKEEKGKKGEMESWTFFLMIHLDPLSCCRRIRGPGLGWVEFGGKPTVANELPIYVPGRTGEVLAVGKCKFNHLQLNLLHLVAVFACTILRETLEDKARKGGLRLLLWWLAICDVLVV